MSCPQCQNTMSARVVGEVQVHRCESCHGLFLPRNGLGALVEAENDWHRDSAPQTQPMPRITEDMVMPPPRPAPARSYIESLFA